MEFPFRGDIRQLLMYLAQLPWLIPDAVSYPLGFELSREPVKVGYLACNAIAAVFPRSDRFGPQCLVECRIS